jgi:polar amino acid transport system permease protein
MGYTLHFGVVLHGQYLDWILQGIVTTAELTLASLLLALVLGVVLTLIRMAPFKPAEWLVAAYVEYHRNVPLLVQILVWYFAMPELLPSGVKAWINARNSEFIFATIALSLCTAAYVSEDLRSGIRSISKGQFEASRALGFSYLGSMYWVIIPQALRIAIPPLINEALLLFKNSSLAMAIGVAELTYQTREVESYTFRTFEAYAVATAVYLAVSFIIMALGALSNERLRPPVR